MYPTQLQYGNDDNGNRYGDKTVSAIMNLGEDLMAIIYIDGGGTIYVRC